MARVIAACAIGLALAAAMAQPSFSRVEAQSTPAISATGRQFVLIPSGTTLLALVLPSRP